MKKFYKRIFLGLLTLLIIITISFSVLLFLYYDKWLWLKDVSIALIAGLFSYLIWYFTFIVIYQYRNKKYINFLLTANTYIINCYDNCLKTICLLEEKIFVKNFIFHKILQDLTNDVLLNNLKNNPFSSHNEILRLASDGGIDSDVYNEYLTIKEEFQLCVILLVIIPDRDENQDVSEAINKMINSLKLKIEEGKRRIETWC